MSHLGGSDLIGLTCGYRVEVGEASCFPNLNWNMNKWSCVPTYSTGLAWALKIIIYLLIQCVCACVCVCLRKPEVSSSIALHCFVLFVCFYTKSRYVALAGLEFTV